MSRDQKVFYSVISIFALVTMVDAAQADQVKDLVAMVGNSISLMIG